MSKKTAAGLVEYAKAQLGKPYWWGTFGQIATAGLLSAKRQQYPSQYGEWNFQKDFGKKVHDCAGLIKGYRWCDTPQSAPHYKASEDVGVYGLYSQCSIKGSMATMPDEPGVLLFRKDLGHVGIYIGEGKAIEAMGKRWGVVETRLSQRNWCYWGKPDWIEYEKSENPQKRSKPTYYYSLRLGLLKPGMEDRQVTSAQVILQAQGYEIGKIVLMDEKTVEAVKSFQRDKAILSDGEIGGETWTRLLRG